ncbi:MAG: methyltransferase domain-containing protein [Polyangiaceae bacterium]
MRMRDTWNRVIYRLWSPIYDPLLANVFRPGRVRAMELLAPRAGERVLLPGVGTGADLELLPEGVEALGIDLSSPMLARARARLPLPGRRIVLAQGDVQRLVDVETESFDAAVLNLILSVVPDPKACFRETLRALRAGGRLVVFDKFLRQGERGSAARRFSNVFSTVLGTDITRHFEDIAAGAPFEVVVDEPSIARGMYRVILVEKR